MKTYSQIRVTRDESINTLFKELNVFWAFSNEQFKEGIAKCNLQEGEKVVDIGAGGYIPKSNVDTMIAGMKSITDTFEQEMKDAKIREKHILYELNNHECFYSGNIDSAFDVLGEGYTRDEVQAVYKKYKSKNNII